MKKMVLFVLATFCLVAILASAALAAPKYTFAVTNDSAEDTVTHLMTLKFAELLEKKSDGAFKAEIYPSAQLGGDRELAQSCQAGDIAFVLQTTAPQVNFVPKLSVFDMPMLFTDLPTARKVLDKFQPVIAKEYEKAQFKILGFGDQGFRVMSSNKEVKALPDFKGIKIRTMENKYHMAFWKEIGANPTPLPWGEVYISLQQGTIVAQENPLEVIVAGKIYEQQKYVIMTNHILHTITIIMSKQIYDGLAPEEQKIVDECARETVLYAREQADQRTANRIDILKKNNTAIVELSDEVKKEMLDKSAPVYKDIRKAVGDELADALMNEVKAAAN